jgi:hypothetical protein
MVEMSYLIPSPVLAEMRMTVSPKREESLATSM